MHGGSSSLVSKSLSVGPEDLDIFDFVAECTIMESERSAKRNLTVVKLVEGFILFGCN